MSDSIGVFSEHPCPQIEVTFELDLSDSKAMESIYSVDAREIKDSNYINNEHLDGLESKRYITVGLDMEDLATMAQLMDIGLKAVFDQENEAFVTTIRENCFEMATMLVKIGAVDVNAKCGEHHVIPLMICTGIEQPDLCNALIEAGSDVNQKSNNGSTALMRAAYNGHEEVVKILIEAGSDVNQKNEDGFTALVKASREGHEEVVRILIEAGSDVNQKDNAGDTALIWAAREGHEKVVRTLSLTEAGSDVNQKNNYGYTALMYAAREGHEKVVRILIEAGSDVNQKNNDDWNAIIWSVHNRHAQISRILLENGADFTAKDSFGRTALDWAKQGSKGEETTELLEYVTRLHRETLFIHAIEFLRNHRQEYEEEEEVREYIPDHVMNGFFRKTIWKKREREVNMTVTSSLE